MQDQTHQVVGYSDPLCMHKAAVFETVAADVVKYKKLSRELLATLCDLSCLESRVLLA